MAKEKCFEIRTQATASVIFTVYAKNKKEAAKKAKDHPMNEMEVYEFFRREDDPEDLEYVKEIK